MELRDATGAVIFKVNSNTGKNDVEDGKAMDVGTDARSILNDPSLCAELIALPEALRALQCKFNILLKAYIDQGFEIPSDLEEDYVKALEES